MTSTFRSGSFCMSQWPLRHRADGRKPSGLTWTYRTKKISTPYFREWTNMRHQKGKTFLSNPKLFKADRALYFPNLRGATLASPSQRKGTDTTPVLRDKISVVSMF